MELTASKDPDFLVLTHAGVGFSVVKLLLKVIHVLLSNPKKLRSSPRQTWMKLSFDLSSLP